MLISNLLVDKGYFNGSTGNVVDIIYPSNGSGTPSLPVYVLVQFDNYTGPSCLSELPRCVPIKLLRRYWGFGDGSFSRENIPLRLCWAVTVHKSQGLTLPKAVVDLSNAKFSAGLTFVALSRVRQLSDFLLAPFTEDRLKTGLQ